MINIRHEPGIFSQTQRRGWHPDRQQRNGHDYFQTIHGSSNTSIVTKSPMKSSEGRADDPIQGGRKFSRTASTGCSALSLG